MTTTYHISDIRQRRPRWSWGVGQDQPCRRPALRGRRPSPARARWTRAPASRCRRRGKRRHFTHRLPPGTPRLDRQAGPPPDRYTGISRFHRQRTFGLKPAVENVVVAVSGPSGIQHPAVVSGGRPAGPGPLRRDHQDGCQNVDYRSHPEAAIRETFWHVVRAVQRTNRAGLDVFGVDVIQSHDEDPAGCPLPPTEAYRMVVEQIVELDEELMMRYLEGDTVVPTKSRRATHDAIAQAGAGCFASAPARTLAWRR